MPTTILLAEDDTAFRNRIGKCLVREGYSVICAEDGYQALEFAIRDRPDLLLLDVHMPAGDGFSVHQRLGRHPELALKPVIYMTHDPSREIEIEAAEDGAAALLHKPFEMRELLEAVRTALKSPGSEAA